LKIFLGILFLTKGCIVFWVGKNLSPKPKQKLMANTKQVGYRLMEEIQASKLAMVEKIN
jgi:hypothetical protein